MKDVANKNLKLVQLNKPNPFLLENSKMKFSLRNVYRGCV